MIVADRLKEKINTFKPLSLEAYNQFLSCAEQIELPKGVVLLDQGCICNHLYFVESGYLRVCCYKDGDEINLDFALEGSFVANIKSLKTNEPSEYIIKSGEKSIITLFDKETLLRLYSHLEEIELLCRKILGTMLIESNDQLEFYKLKTPLERYRFLLDNKPCMIQKIPVSQLSSYIGVARETLSRFRKNIV